MANYFIYKDKKFHVGDLLRIVYKIKEGEKEREQNFDGILLKVKGNEQENKTITIRKISKSGIGVERIFPLSSPWIVDIKLKKPTSYKKASVFFIRNLSEKELRQKLYKSTKKVSQ